MDNASEIVHMLFVGKVSSEAIEAILESFLFCHMWTKWREKNSLKFDDSELSLLGSFSF
jgi:hypothetical protein